jgi:hypothetical protein
MEGEGIQDMINVAKRGLQKVAGLKKKATRTVNALLYGATNYPRPVRDMIRKYGDRTITHMDVGRTPVQSAITTAINIVSMGKFKENADKLGYDKLFHLFLKLTLDNTQIILEKNEVINIVNFQERPNTEIENVPLGNPITLNELLGRAKEKMGDRFFRYDSAVNNCQDFILNILQASSLGNPQIFSFVKQKTEELFKDSGKTRSVAKFFTDLGGRANALINGAGVSDYVVQCVCFPLSYGVKEAKKWLKESGYKCPKVDETENQLRFRQIAPTTVKKNGYTDYRTKEIGEGIQLVLVYKNKISGEGMPKFAKGSKEAKEFMAKLRAMRSKKMKGGSVEGTPVDVKGGGMVNSSKMAGGYGLYVGRGMSCNMSDSDSDEETKKGGEIKRAIEKRAEMAMGCGVVHHHHHYMDGKHIEGGSFWKSVGNFALNTVKDVGKQAIRKVLPIAGRTLGGLAGAKLGGPAGAMMGQNYGGQAGEELANVATSGWGIKNGVATGKGLFAGKGLRVMGEGVKRKGRFEKGSPEAKAWGEKMRALRKNA